MSVKGDRRRTANSSVVLSAGQVKDVELISEKLESVELTCSRRHILGTCQTTWAPSCCSQCSGTPSWPWVEQLQRHTLASAGTYVQPITGKLAGADIQAGLRISASTTQNQINTYTEIKLNSDRTHNTARLRRHDTSRAALNHCRIRKAHSQDQDSDASREAKAV